MNKVCARCEKTVYPIEELKCLDKIWHKTCFKCYECGMTLNMKTYKGFNKLPYCNAHTPVARATTVADTPENRRLAENTKIQSQVKYHADFEQQKGKLTQVADDPETLRIRNTSKIISNVSYHGEYEKKKQMEERRNLLENENGNHAAPTYIPVVEKPGAKSAVSSSSAVSYASNNNVPPQPLMHQQQPVAKNPTSSTVDNYHQRNPTSYTSYGNNNGNNPVEQSTRNDYYRANNVTTQKLAAAVAPNPNANYISDPRYVNAPMAGHQYQHHQQQHYHQQHQPQAPAVPQQQQPQLSHDNRYYSGAMTAQSNANVKAYGATNLGRCFRAIYDYTAQDVDEVSFMDGDLIVHCQPIDDGWMTGTVQRTGQTGMLPSNYVETA